MKFHFQKFLSKCDFLMLYLRVFYYGSYCIILAGFKRVPLKWLKTFQGWETYEKNSELYIYLFLYKDYDMSLFETYSTAYCC